MTDPQPEPAQGVEVAAPEDRPDAGLRAALALCDVPIDLDQRIRLADSVSRAGILPNHLRGNPANVLAICFAAHALQIPLWPAMQEMNCIEGKIGISAHLMRGLWQRAGHRFRVVERTLESATVEATRIGDEPYLVTWTIDDALLAGLCYRDGEGVIRARPKDKPNKALPWELYTKAMLVARATSAALREVGADVLMGFGYTADELTGGVYLDGEGPVHVTTGVAESPEQVAARVAKAQNTYDQWVAAIEAAATDEALRDLWRQCNDAGIVRLTVENREGTLEQRILAARERRAADLAQAAAEATADCPGCGSPPGAAHDRAYEGDGPCPQDALTGPVVNR